VLGHDRALTDQLSLSAKPRRARHGAARRGAARRGARGAAGGPVRSFSVDGLLGP
jgi:hypothetical protein